MSYPKLGTYRGTVNKIRKKYRITPLDFDIMLYISERDLTSKYDILKNVTNSKGTVQKSITYMHKMGYIRDARPYRTGAKGFSSGWVLTGKGRSVVLEFYMVMFPDAQ